MFLNNCVLQVLKYFKSAQEAYNQSLLLPIYTKLPLKEQIGFLPWKSINQDVRD